MKPRVPFSGNRYFQSCDYTNLCNRQEFNKTVIMYRRDSSLTNPNTWYQYHAAVVPFCCILHFVHGTHPITPHPAQSILTSVCSLLAWFFQVVSGTSLKVLHATATGNQVATIIAEDGPLKIVGSIFDTSIEMFAGRAAMMGIVSLILIEAITGSGFFHP